MFSVLVMFPLDRLLVWKEVASPVCQSDVKSCSLIHIVRYPAMMAGEAEKN